jgi:TolB-like protein/Tfp pilus assembly protein PilF
VTRDKPGFLEELKRRHVWRVAIAYAVAGWLLVQVATQVFPFFNIPDWAVRLVVVLIVIGFPAAVAFAWIYEVTPGGIRRTMPADSPEARPEAAQRHLDRKLNALIVVVLVLAVALLGWRLYAIRNAPPDAGSIATAASVAAGAMATAEVPTSAGTTPAIPAKSIAVLPFDNLSRDPDNEYFVAGMQDLILTRLAGIGALKVISRTSTEQYASHPENLKQIARDLGVAHIVEGSVQKVGNDVLISVQLVDARTDHHVWAQSYQRTLDDIFGVEGEVAGKIAAELQARLSAPEASAVAQVPTTNPHAYDAYLRGLGFMRQAENGDWTGNVPQAIAAFRRATAEDPDFALAWAWASIARAHARYWGVDQTTANLQAEEVEAKRALELAPLLPEAHRAMGHVQRFVHHDFAAAREEFQQAVDLRPNDAEALASLAVTDWNLRNLDAAIEGFRRAIALDPQDTGSHTSLGVLLTITGDFTAARQALQRALVIDPRNARAYLALSRLEIRQDGDEDAALRVLEQMAPGTPVNAEVVTTRIDLLASRRRFTEARSVAGQYANTFTTGPAAIDLAFARADLEWLAGNTRDARPLYRTAITRLTHDGNDINPQDRVRLSLAHARLGDEETAMQELALAYADKRWARANENDEGYKLWILARIQLGLGKRSAAIDTVRRMVASSVSGGVSDQEIRENLRTDPVWDPLRDDPRFQVLLETSRGMEQQGAGSE